MVKKGTGYFFNDEEMKHFGDFINKIICGDCLEVMKGWMSESVDMIMTSPPYYGLRDYGFEQIFGGKKNCKHEWEGRKKSIKRFDDFEGGKSRNEDRYYGDDPTRKFYGQHEKHESNIYCRKCKAWKGQLGLEPTSEMYIEHLTRIFSEAKRVLKKEGTLWLNMGDSYQDKCLCMIPEDLARSLKQDGWKLRNKIIWFKPNSMPSSARDRFSNRWEYIFLFSKNKKYYFDLDAIREPHHLDSIARKKRGVGPDHKYADKPSYGGGGGLNKPRVSLKDKRKGLNVPGQEPHGIHRKRHSGYFGEDGEYLVNPLGKNPGDHWKISTVGFPGAHFAVFPEKLCEKPIKAGCPEEVCKKCGKARERIIEESIRTYEEDLPHRKGKKYGESTGGGHGKTSILNRSNGDAYLRWRQEHPDKTIGWTSCDCKAGFEPGIVLDPFAGAGTALYVAKQLRRRFIGIDIKKEYCNLCEKKLAQGVL